MKEFKTDVRMGEGPGIEIARHVTHHGFFFGHHDAELEERVIPAADSFEAGNLEWPKQAIVLRVRHRIVRVRTIWGEEFPEEPETLVSSRVFLWPGAQVVRSRQALRELRASLRDVEDAERLLQLGKADGIVTDPERGIWGKLRPGERALPA
jgi:hypothetical protein